MIHRLLLLICFARLHLERELATFARMIPHKFLDGLLGVWGTLVCYRDSREKFCRPVRLRDYD